jgi:hypothetical protein
VLSQVTQEGALPTLAPLSVCGAELRPRSTGNL